MTNLIEYDASEFADKFADLCVEGDKVWLARDDEEYLYFREPDGRVLFPIWTSEAMARACLDVRFPDCEALKMNIEEFLAKILQSEESRRNDFRLFLNPAPSGKGLKIWRQQFGDMICEAWLLRNGSSDKKI